MGANWDLAKVLAVMKTPVPNLVLVTSHRGNWEFCPENTIESFQAAWDLGAQAVEMDVRVSKPDSANGYPNGEVFLSHDFDIRGEALLPTGTAVADTSRNYIYDLTRAELKDRRMVDRRGRRLVDSQGNSLLFRTFSELLDSVVARAKTLPDGVVRGDGAHGYSKVKRGSLIVIDIKGDPPQGIGKDQYDVLLECLRELDIYEDAHQLDLTDAVAFKIGYKKMPTVTQFTADLQQLGVYPKWKLPPLIFIVFPEDAVAPAGCGKPDAPACTVIAPANNQVLYSYTKTYPRFLVSDFQFRNPGNALSAYVDAARTDGEGVAMFLASNNFADGVRNSNGTCAARSTPIQGWFQSACYSDPMGVWASSTMDFLVPDPSLNIKRATSITTDQFQNALDYLTGIGLANTAAIQ